MSTRGAFGYWRDGIRWEGVYIRSDAYPGYALPELAYAMVFREEEALPERMVEARAEAWQFLEEGGVCPFCGREGVGMPVDIRGDIYALRYRFAREPILADAYREEIARLERAAEEGDQGAAGILEDLRHTGWPDPGERYHGHWDPRVGHLNADPLFLEWAYLVTRGYLSVLRGCVASRPGGRPATERIIALRLPGGEPLAVVDHGHCVAAFTEVARLGPVALAQLAWIARMKRRAEGKGQEEAREAVDRLADTLTYCAAFVAGLVAAAWASGKRRVVREPETGGKELPDVVRLETLNRYGLELAAFREDLPGLPAPPRDAVRLAERRLGSG